MKATVDIRLIVRKRPAPAPAPQGGAVVAISKGRPSAAVVVRASRPNGETAA